MKQPSITYIDKNNWKLTEDFQYNHYNIPKGFITDLASVPRVLWAIIPPFGKWISATVIHDYLYRELRPESRKEADKSMLSIMLDYNVKKIVALIMYYSVRIFGNKRWKEYGT